MSGSKKRRRGWKLKRPRARSNQPPNAWQRSLTFRQIARASIIAFNQRKHLLPKCGAKTRAGGLCKNLAKENGRCRLHGGNSPTGQGWGKRQFVAKPPGKQTASDWRRAEAKLQRQAAEDRDRVRRLRSMSDEQFWQYARRMGKRVDDPHSPTIRKAMRDEWARRGPDPSKQQLATALARAQNPELQEIEDRIAELRAELLNARPTGGVFD